MLGVAWLSAYDQGIGFSTKIKKLLYRSLMNTCLEIAWLIIKRGGCDPTVGAPEAPFSPTTRFSMVTPLAQLRHFLDVIAMIFLSTIPDGVHLLEKNQYTLEWDKGFVKLKHIVQYHASCLRCSSQLRIVPCALCEYEDKQYLSYLD
jgi:hypothetical protein